MPNAKIENFFAYCLTKEIYCDILTLNIMTERVGLCTAFREGMSAEKFLSEIRLKFTHEWFCRSFYCKQKRILKPLKFKGVLALFNL